MYVPTVKVHEPATIADATALLERHAPDARFLAGGTDLLVDLKTGRLECEHLISINSLDELRGVHKTDRGLRIGALTTIGELDRSPLLTGVYSAIRDATSRMAAPQVRNSATVGGNLAGAVPCADLPPILITLNASVVIWSSKGERVIRVEDLVVGPRETAMLPGEILTGIIIPREVGGYGAAYERFSLRNGNAIAVAGVAAGLLIDEEDTVREARIALAAVAPVPRLATAAGVALVGRPLDEQAIDEAAEAAMEAAEPISDIRGSAGYRREIVGVLARRALAKAYQRATTSGEVA